MVVDFITAVYYPVISLLCPVWVRALYGVHETSGVLFVGMPGIFLRVLSFLSDLLICDRRGNFENGVKLNKRSPTTITCTSKICS